METLITILGWIFLLLVTLLGIFPVIGGFVYRARTNKCPRKYRLDGKTVIITGASAGVGKLAAYDIARRGARVIMACRNLTKTKPIADDIMRETGNKNVVVQHLDLSDMSSVRTFAAKMNKEESKIDILINNGGMIYYESVRKTSIDGLELTMATNHYGCFLLTNLLIDKLKASSPSRIITVSSSGHEMDVLHLDDLNYETRAFGGIEAYCQSKLCNVLFTKELSRRLQGTSVTANSLHPGFVATDIFDMNHIYGILSELLAKIVARTVEQGAQTHIYLAASDEVKDKSGGYYVNCNFHEVKNKAANMELARELWETSARDVKLSEAEASI